MKKILCLALALAMVMSLVPVAFAAPAAQSKAIDRETVMASAQPTELAASVQAPELQDVANLHNTKNAVPQTFTTFNTDDMSTMGTWHDLPAYLIELMDPQDVDGNIYIFDNKTEEGGLAWADADLEYGDTGFGTWIVPSTSNSQDGNIRDKGDHLFLNVNVYNGYQGGSGGAQGIEFAEDITVEARVFMGYEGDSNLALYDLYLGTNGVTIDVTVPENNMQVWFFVFAYVDRQSTDVAFFMTPCMYNTRWDTMDKSKATDLAPDKKVSVDTEASSNTEIVTPEYYFTNAKMFKFEAEANSLYKVRINGEGQGFTYIIMDDDMQIITNIYAGSGVVNNGDYSNFEAPFWTPYGGTFYIVVGGFYLGDKGLFDFSVETDDESTFHSTKIDINLSDFGHESYTDPNGKYAYTWSSAYNYGMLQFVKGAEFNLTGKNDEVVVWAEEWQTINMNNCTVNSIVLYNRFGPVVFNITGTLKVEGNIRDKIWNYGTIDAEHQYGNTAYFVGDNLTLDGENGVYVENYNIRFYVKTLDITANVQPGYYPVTLWACGHYVKTPKFGKNFKFSDSKIKLIAARIASVDALGFESAIYCYTFSEYEELYYLEDPDLTNVPERVVITSDGAPEVVGGLFGDVNDNGKLDTGDATLILRFLVGAMKLSDAQQKVADYNGNGKVDTGDATLILRAIVTGK